MFVYTAIRSTAFFSAIQRENGKQKDNDSSVSSVKKKRRWKPQGPYIRGCYGLSIWDYVRVYAAVFSYETLLEKEGLINRTTT